MNPRFNPLLWELSTAGTIRKVKLFVRGLAVNERKGGVGLAGRWCRLFVRLLRLSAETKVEYTLAA